MVQEKTKGVKHALLERPWFVAVALAGLIGGAMIITSLTRAVDERISMCSTAKDRAKAIAEYSATPLQLQAIVHYATSRIVPQQSLPEITVTLDVLKDRSPCNFLVFGLGHDSLMWASLNPRGTTVFLEEDPDWIGTVLKAAPSLHAHHVTYRTKLSEADRLLATYRSKPRCLPSKAFPIRYNEECPLALTSLPDEIYETEWDLIMIDAPRGYFAAAPGRMSAIFSAATMARNRRGQGMTHVFLHDVDRKVEKTFAEEFLCRKFRVNSSGRLWHFEIPNAANMSGEPVDRFC
ncbi:PREDICTED: probable methyltransferase At1g27930 [Tarenaya hassleriana]|uniref:probable methyltransferase At1g27930 n=1 Tax=Tarenaya hassleriana TaxID=28532 RepID=UPI00053C53AE|nr:PREDICTED: probable methyltransferase At1g27930 [Tarenaya hassleriana]